MLETCEAVSVPCTVPSKLTENRSSSMHHAASLSKSLQRLRPSLYPLLPCHCWAALTHAWGRRTFCNFWRSAASINNKIRMLGLIDLDAENMRAAASWAAVKFDNSGRKEDMMVERSVKKTQITLFCALS